MHELEYYLGDFEFDSDSGLYVHKKTNLPITMIFDHESSSLILLDQRKLPYECISWATSDWKEAALVGIKEMIVRGSQAIGCAAVYSFLLASNSFSGDSKTYISFMEQAYETILNTRPTAVNLSWALKRIMNEIKTSQDQSVSELQELVKRTADQIFIEDMIINAQMRNNGLNYVEDGDVIFTHCNAGSLATSYGGSSLSIFIDAYSNGCDITALVKETRPRSQGYKLTMWELDRAGIPVIGITDNMVSSAYKKYKATKVFTGADRISKDGNVANKVGTNDLAIIANYYDIPFFVAASYSTLDLYVMGKDIPIEVRDDKEISNAYHCEILIKKQNKDISQKATDFWPHKDTKIQLYNPAFDVTPASLINKIILDIGVYSPNEISSISQHDIDTKIGALYRDNVKN